MRKAVYPGTFDPFTRGHEDLLRRAIRLFDEVVVGVSGSPRKGPFFAMEERVAMAREVIGELPGVTVVGFDSLLLDFLRGQKARVIVRGLRAVSDFEYEFQMAGMNRSLEPQLETVFLTPGEQHMFVSASIVREIAWYGGDVSQFVQPVVERRLKAKVAALRGSGRA